MSGQEWVCALCSRSKASGFCYCIGVETFLCKDCFPSHNSKNEHIVHLAYPVSAYGLHRNSEYIERLKARQKRFEAARKEALGNIEAVVACIEGVTIEVQAVVNALREYEMEQISKLQEILKALNLELNEAMQEVDKTMYEDCPILTYPLSNELREYGGTQSNLKFFGYRIDSSAIAGSIQSLLSFTFSKINHYGTHPTIVGISGTRLRVYDIASDSHRDLTLAQAFTDGISTCILPAGFLFCVGGRPASTQTSIIHLKTAQIEECQAMNDLRWGPGLICVDFFVYAFGSYESNNSCECFDVKVKEWQRLPDMLFGRHAFSPSHYAGSIYLVTTKEPIEIYNIATKSFSVLDVEWSGSSKDSSSLFVNEELFIFTAREMGRWKPGSDKIAISESWRNIIEGSSQCQPVLNHRNAYFVAWRTGEIFKFNLDSLGSIWW